MNPAAPQTPQPDPRRRTIAAVLGILAGIVLVLALSLRTISVLYTDYLWFDHVKLGSVWSGLLGARILPSMLLFVVSFIGVLATLLVADRVAPKELPPGPDRELVMRVRQFMGTRRRLIWIGVSILVALVTIAGVADNWNEWILFRNGGSFGVSDPQFGKDVGFYVFKLPFYTLVTSWLFNTLIIIFIVSVGVHYLNGGIRVQIRPGEPRSTPAVKAHLSVILAAIALVRAFAYYLNQFELSFSSRGRVQGASFTDVTAQLPAYRLLILISLAAAVLLIINIRRRGWVLPVIAVALWLFVSVVVGEIYPTVIQRFRVLPNELAKETPYIARNIEGTRAAYGLDEVQTQTFDYQEDLDASAVNAAAQTLLNVRLWDPDLVLSTFEQLQAGRQFYEFTDLDIDRYQIDGQLTQTLLGVRELNGQAIPSGWPSKHLEFTHGYGLALAPSNRVVDGRPDFIAGGIPVVSEEIPIDQPDIYFGEGLSDYVLVGVDQDEFDYPEGDSNRRTRYEGSAGVSLDGWLRRMAFAFRFEDPSLFLSREPNKETRVLYQRNVTERVKELAPFLDFDSDPYAVIVEGKVYWIVDAYTSTQSYPYSQGIRSGRLPEGSGLSKRVNYVRNSVKAVVDAYDGTVTFYVVDDEDPIVRAYRKAFPDLFTDGDEVPPEMAAHFRYPEDLFRIQTDVYREYHQTDPRTFYAETDLWEIAQNPDVGEIRTRSTASGSAGTVTVTSSDSDAVTGDISSSAARMDPYYLLMRLPGERVDEFVLSQPFVPSVSRNQRDLGNLLSFVVARSDPGHYGELVSYTMPKDETVPGPAQVNNVIANEADISSKISLLNQQGSKVIQGSLQIVPVGDSILYVRPLYVQGEGDAAFPELEFVVVVYAGEAVFDTTLEGAISQLFGPEAAIGPDEDANENAANPTAGASDAERLAGILEDARAAQRRADDALKKGDLGAYQQAVDEVGELIDDAERVARRLVGDSDTSSSTTETSRPAQIAPESDESESDADGQTGTDTGDAGTILTTTTSVGTTSTSHAETTNSTTSN